LWKVGAGLAALSVLILLPTVGLSPLGAIVKSIGAYTINPEVIDNIDSVIDIVPDEAPSGEPEIPEGPLVPIDHSKTGVIYPLFGYPSSMWDDMIKYRRAHGSLPWIAIINPHNGPEASPSIKSYVDRMRDSNIQVLGYVSTFWGAVSVETVKQDINEYARYYDLDGIFFDEMSNQQEYVEFYREITEYAKTSGMNYVIGNTGTDAAPAYVGVVDNIVISEGYGTPTLSRLGGWHVEHPRENFSYVAYSQYTIDSEFVATSSTFASYMYVTDDDFPNPYDKLPSHFDELLALLDPDTPSAMHNVVAKSVDLAGAPVNGTLQISRGSEVVQEGQQWVTHVSSNGDTYEVRALDSRGHEFEHWEDGSTSPRRTVGADQSSIVMTAYYRTASTAEQGVTVSAVTGNGASLSMWTVIESGGQTVQTGFTPMRFSGTPGQQYTVYVSDWRYMSFDRWMDESAANPYTFTYSGEGYLAAYYDHDSPTTPHDTLTVNTYDEDGNIVTMWTSIREGDAVVSEGYTPLTIQVERNKTYSVGVADWEDTVFERWQDGSESRRIQVTVDEPHERLTAYYRAGSNPPRAQ
jgi:hypothetical protein